MNLAAYDRFVAAASPMGQRIFFVSGGILVSVVVAMVIYVIRNGERDEPEEGVVTVDRPMSPVFFKGIGVSKGTSKRKVLASKSGFISDESLVDGTATFGQRMMVLGTIVLFACFFLLFVGAGLMGMESNPLAILLPIVPGVFVFNFARDAWRDHQTAKQAFAAKRTA
jgi:hypothetical protein